MRIRVIASRLLAMTLAALEPAVAAPVVTVAVAPHVEGFAYSYTVESDLPGQQIGQFVVFGLAGYDLDSVESPDGWAVALPLFDDVIAWSVVDPAALAALGNPIGGFAFVSTFDPGDGGFLTVFEAADEQGELLAFGTTSVPAAGVPEPAALLLVVSGFAMLGARSRKTSSSRSA